MMSREEKKLFNDEEEPEDSLLPRVRPQRGVEDIEDHLLIELDEENQDDTMGSIL